MAERRFPVLDQRPRQEQLAIPWPSHVPWSLLEPHESQALKNHGQTLERLAQRHGLSLCEMLAIIERRPWRRMGDQEALDGITALVETFEAPRSIHSYDNEDPDPR